VEKAVLIDTEVTQIGGDESGQTADIRWAGVEAKGKGHAA